MGLVKAEQPKLSRSSSLVEHSNLVILKLEKIGSLMKDAETGQRGFLLTSHPSFLEPYTGSLHKAVLATNEVAVLIHNNADQRNNLCVIKDLLLIQGKVLKQLIDKKLRCEISMAAFTKK